MDEAEQVVAPPDALLRCGEASPRTSLRRVHAGDVRAAQRPRRARLGIVAGITWSADIVKDVRGGESNCEQDSRKM